MSKALETWRKKLEYLQQQQAILSDPAQLFTLAEQIKEAETRIAELEKPVLKRLPWRKLMSVTVLLVVLGVAGFIVYTRSNAPEIKPLAAGAGFLVLARPDQDAEIIHRVEAGEHFELVIGKKRNPNWALVRCGSREGWVMAQDMNYVTPIEVAKGFGFRGSYWQLFFTAPQPKDSRTNEFGINPRFAQAIAKCKTSLDIAIYELNDQLVTRSILDAHVRGVKVRIVTDGQSLEERGSTFGGLRQSGVPVVAKRKGGGIMHSKFAIMDNTTVWTGSWNYTEIGTFGNNENVIAIDSPEIAGVFAKKFEQLFHDGPERSKQTNAVRVIGTASLPHGVRVFFAPEDPTLEVFKTVLAQAKETIKFMTLVVADTETVAMLSDRAAKGIKVQGIIERKFALSPVAKSLLAASVPNLEVRLDGNPRRLRHNCVIVDDRLVLFGSMNISAAGAKTNDENLVAIPDPALALKFSEEFERLWAISRDPKRETSAQSDPEKDAAVNN